MNLAVFCDESDQMGPTWKHFVGLFRLRLKKIVKFESVQSKHDFRHWFTWSVVKIILATSLQGTEVLIAPHLARLITPENLGKTGYASIIGLFRANRNLPVRHSPQHLQGPGGFSISGMRPESRQSS